MEQVRCLFQKQQTGEGNLTDVINKGHSFKNVARCKAFHKQLQAEKEEQK